MLNYQACTYTWCEIAEVVWESLFSVCCAHACQALPLWSELTNNTLRKQRWGTFFTLNFECHNRYNKLLLCNSENGDIAWCNKTNTEWGLSVLKKRTKTSFFLKKRKKTFFCKYPKINRWVVFLKQASFSQPHCRLYGCICDKACRGTGIRSPVLSIETV